MEETTFKMLENRKNYEEIEIKYDLIETIGKGSYATVKLAK